MKSSMRLRFILLACLAVMALGKSVGSFDDNENQPLMVVFQDFEEDGFVGELGSGDGTTTVFSGSATMETTLVLLFGIHFAKYFL